MTSRTVIEELVVTLGLDPAKYNKEIKDAGKKVDELTQTVEKSATRQANALDKVIKKYFGLFAVIALIKKGFNVIGDAAHDTWDLANAARHLNQTAGGLRNWENAVESLGGKAEDARSSMENFQKSMFDLVTKGSVGGNLEMLARLGVRFQDASGHARDYGEVAKDTAAAIQRNIANKQLTRAEGYRAARESGFDDATSNAMSGTDPNALAKALAETKGRSNITRADVAATTNVAQSRVRKDQELQLAAVKAADTPLGQAVEEVQDAFTNFAKWMMSPERFWNSNSKPAAPPGISNQTASGRAKGSFADRLHEMAAGASAPLPSIAAAGGTTVNTTHISIGTVTTQATDGRGLVRDLRKEGRKTNVATADAGSR